jgi:hypothetical protein
MISGMLPFLFLILSTMSGGEDILFRDKTSSTPKLSSFRSMQEDSCIIITFVLISK